MAWGYKDTRPEVHRAISKAIMAQHVRAKSHKELGTRGYKGSRAWGHKATAPCRHIVIRVQPGQKGTEQ